MSSTLIRVVNLTKHYASHDGGLVRAVENVNFECRAGEVFGLLGLNGAGKTTTLRMLSTALSPTSGSAEVCGHDVVRDSLAVRASIGFLSGTTGLYHRFTAREMIAFFGRLNGIPKDQLQRRVDEIMQLFGVDKYAKTRCEKLSTGMKQKVNIARTVVHDPAVLILDEPTSGLDVLAAATTIDFVREYRDRGKCVVFSTHIMSEAERLCDRIAIIHGGSIRAIGTLAELRQSTGEHYLEDIFRHLVREEAA